MTAPTPFTDTLPADCGYAWQTVAIFNRRHPIGTRVLYRAPWLGQTEWTEGRTVSPAFCRGDGEILIDTLGGPTMKKIREYKPPEKLHEPPE